MTMDELYQDRVWTQRNGVTMKIKRMGPSHRRNLLTWIERNAARLKRAELDAAWRFSMCLQGEMAIDAMDREIDRLESITPERYVDELPLVVKLRKRVARDAVLSLAERARLDAEAKGLAERLRREAVLASFDEPDSVERPPRREHTPAEDAAFDREWGRGFPRPHPASLDDDWRLVPTMDGWG